MKQLEPLDPELAQVAESLREDEPISPETKRRLQQRLQLSVGLVATAASTSAAATSLGGGSVTRSAATSLAEHSLRTKVLLPLVFAAGGVTGVGVKTLVDRRAPAEPTQINSQVVAPTPVVAPPQTLSTATQAASTPAPSSPAHKRRTAPVADEQALVESVRTALMRDDPQNALSQLDIYRSRFANGTLQEEATALQVHALLGVGRKEDAAREAKRFLSTYPKSIFRQLVESALEAPSP